MRFCEDQRMIFDPGLAVRPVSVPLGFEYQAGTFGPEPELRNLDSIRPSLRSPCCSGPDPVYAIAMDVGRIEHRTGLERRLLLFGLVTYACGQLGQEPVRSQGHVHCISGHSGWRAPELFEVWTGAAYIYMQEYGADDPGRCFAILARPRDLVIVPPGWFHTVVSARPDEHLTFLALCDREYGFEYDEIRKRGGLAWFPVLADSGEISWEPNPAYRQSSLSVRRPRNYQEFGIVSETPLYRQVTDNFDKFSWISNPLTVSYLWQNFAP
jgi:glucose-6-phosphate isomerase